MIKIYMKNNYQKKIFLSELFIKKNCYSFLTKFKKNPQLISNNNKSIRPFTYKLPEKDPIIKEINSILIKNKKEIKAYYSIFICDKNPNKLHILECLKKDIEFLCKSNIFFFAVFYKENENPANQLGKSIYINFYIERKIESYYFDYFSNFYKFLNSYYYRYLRQRFYFKIGTPKEYLIIIRNFYYRCKFRIYYFLFDLDLIQALDNLRPIEFIKKFFINFSRWILFFWGFFEQYPWKRHNRYLKVLAINMYSFSFFKKNFFIRFCNWVKNFFYKLEIITSMPDIPTVKIAFLEQFIYREEEQENIKPNLFETYLNEDIYRLRITENWEELTEITESLNINSKIIGSIHFSSLKDKLKIKK